MSNNKIGVIVGTVLIICGAIGAGYHYYQTKQQEAKQASINDELVNCEQEASAYLQQYNETPLLPQHDNYLAEYNSAIAQCKQQY